MGQRGLPHLIYIKSKRDLEKMRIAGRIAAEILQHLGEVLKAGMSTKDIDDIVVEQMAKNNVKAATLGYRPEPHHAPFPASVCTSINSVVCHGVPSPKVVLKPGDIINCDVTTIYEGRFGDTSRTYCIGAVKPEIAKLVQVTEQAMYKGIEAARSGNCVNDIGGAIEDFIKPFGYGIVKEFSGHGVGCAFHEDPAIFHYRHPTNRYKLKPGVTLTVEPMINLGTSDIRMDNDGWTVYTADGKRSAQFEHTIAILEDGIEILTRL